MKQLLRLRLLPFLLVLCASEVRADPLDSTPLYSYRFGFENEDSFALPSGSSLRRRAPTGNGSFRNSKSSWATASEFIERNVFQNPTKRFRAPSLSQFSLSNLSLNGLEAFVDSLSQQILSSLGNLLGRVLPVDSAMAEGNALSFEPSLNQSEDSADFASSERIARRLYRERSAIAHF